MPMTRSFLTCLAGLCLTISAQAQMPPWSSLPILPPVGYDHAYGGTLHINRLNSQAAIRLQCPYTNFGNFPALGCVSYLAGNLCIVNIATDDLLATVGVDFDIALRHEIGHCNGWPATHPGSRIPEKMQRFPK